MNKTVVLLKTHIWSDDIELFAIKIYKETHLYGIDFYILMHITENENYDIKNEQLKKNIIKFTENEIKNIYSSGFISMWLSNHWILMWYYKNFGLNYKYFWSIEYDVRISGDSSKIWLHDSPIDFLYTKGNYRNIKHPYIKLYTGKVLTDLEKFFGYLQLARYSNQALAYLDHWFSQGENGPDELIIYSLINKSELTGSKKFLQSLVAGTWTWENKYSQANKQLFDYCESLQYNNNVYIFHPVK